MKAGKVKCKSIKSYFDKDSSKKKQQQQSNAVKILSETFGHTNFKSSLQRDAVACVNEGQTICNKLSHSIYNTLIHLYQLHASLLPVLVQVWIMGDDLVTSNFLLL